MAEVTEVRMLDVSHPKEIEVLIRADGKILWINVDGVCLLRACKIKHINIVDERK